MPGIKQTKIHDILSVVDNVFSEAELDIVDAYFSSYTDWGLGYDEMDYGASTATLCRSLKWDQWVGKHTIFADIDVMMRQRLGDFGIDVPLFSRCLINNFKFGDSPMFHKDAPGNPKSQTFMIYPNKVWDKNWGGFTAFADDDDEVVAVAAPRPGRIAIFAGNVSHTGVAPTKIHKGYGRFSIAYQDPDGFPLAGERRTVNPIDIAKTSNPAAYDNPTRLF